MPVFHLLYASTASWMLSADDIEGLLFQARERNLQHGITGMLIHASGRFIHALEGTPEDVDALYEAICRDPRHYDVRSIFSYTDEHRDFPDQPLAFSQGPLTPALRSGVGSGWNQTKLQAGLQHGRPVLELLGGIAAA